MMRVGTADIFRTKSVRHVWGRHYNVYGGQRTFFFSHGEGAETTVRGLGSTWLINPAAVQKDALFFLSFLFFVLLSELRTSYTTVTAVTILQNTVTIFDEHVLKESTAGKRVLLSDS